MKVRKSASRKVFLVVNTFLLLFLAAMCLLPFVNIIAISLSDKYSVSAGLVSFWPKNVTLYSYQHLVQRPSFWRAFTISVIRTVVGTLVNLILITMTAYPLSKSSAKLRGRTVYAWYFFICMLIGGGLIPSYILISNLGLKNTIWALILPGCLPAGNVVLMLNFFRQIPSELEEAALIDGANHARVLVQVYVPVSLPSIATIALFCMVSHWNAWFDGMLYMSDPTLVPLQTYLRTAITEVKADSAEITDPDMIEFLSDRALKCAQIIITCIPILCVYPFLQRYFVTGLVLGSVKG